MRILVTGGAGFIGSHIVDAYLALGHQVVVIDNLATGNLKNLNSKAIFYKTDIRDYAALKKILQKEQPEIINHQAAQAAVTLSGKNPLETYEVNVMGTLNLLIAAAGIQKFIFASTGGAIYGNLTEHAFTETDPPQPVSAYGVSKLMAEEAITFYAREKKIDFTIFRPGNVFGPRQNPHGEAGICAILSLQMSQNQQPTIYNKEASRDYVFVSDIVTANVLALTKGSGVIMNLGTGQETLNETIFRTIAKEYNYAKEPIYKPARPGEVNRTAGSGQLAKKVLGWQPTVSLAEGIRKIHDSK